MKTDLKSKISMVISEIAKGLAEAVRNFEEGQSEMDSFMVLDHLRSILEVVQWLEMELNSREGW